MTTSPGRWFSLKTVIRYISILLLLLLSCRDTHKSISPNENCFILGGCEKSDYDLENLYYRLSFIIDGKYTFMQSGYLNRSLISENLYIPVRDIFELCGRVLYNNSSVQSSLTFILEPPDSLVSSTIVDTDEGGNFCVMLKKGVYNLLISPHKQDAIPQLFKKIEISEDTSDLSISYPDEDIRFVYGRVLLDAKSGLPVKGISVVAYKEISKDIVLKSNLSTTNDTGDFSLVIPDSDSEYSLRLSGSPVNPDWPTITFRDIITDGVVQLQAITLDSVPPLRHIIGQVSSGERSQLIAIMKNDWMSYRKTFTTDSDGYFETDLREGEYDIIIAPEDIFSSRWGISTWSSIKVPDTKDYEFKPSTKILVEGKIINDPKTRINLSRSGGCRGTDDIKLFTTILPEEDGSFVVKVSQGLYRISVESLDTQRTLILSNQMCIDKDTDLGDIGIPESTILRGRIENLSGHLISKLRLDILLKEISSQDFIPVASYEINGGEFSVRVPYLNHIQIKDSHE